MKRLKKKKKKRYHSGKSTGPFVYIGSIASVLVAPIDEAPARARNCAELSPAVHPLIPTTELWDRYKDSDFTENETKQKL